MRTLVVLLSLGLVFLTGMVIGMDQENGPNASDVNTGETIEQTEEKQVIIEQQPPNEEPEMPESPEHFTQKTAAFLESGVKGFYELVVGVTYQLVQVFF
ncbi:hypothetical protein [Lentibacillus salinarum]|uniref:DUF3679 domain-containing protein n=1 Tax=Lentibacillus salinarum TaxID=446820 RepID=A0ABW3ZZ02_9BACI